MAKLEDLRKVKDQATRAIEKRQYGKAAELYLDIAAREPDPDWFQRAGEALRRDGRAKEAVQALAQAAAGYAQGGFLLKAIAVGKTLLQVDPTHTATQAMLAELYARRDGGARPPVVSTNPSANANVDILPPPPAPRVAVEELLDQHGRDTVAAPIEILPLHRVLGGEPATVEGAPAVATTEVPGVYEIALGDDDFELEAELEVEAPVQAELAVPIPSLPRAPVVLADETDFGGVMDEPAPVPVPAPAPAPIAVRDETDFGGVMDEPPPPPPPAAPARLPRIPLLSSLNEAELRLVIERMTLRELEGGEVLIRQGERGGSLFVVVEGKVRVVSGDRELALLGAGAFVGELGLLTDEPRSATVEAAQPSQLLEISRELAWEIIRQSPEVLRTLLRFCRDRVMDRLIERSPLFSGLDPEDARGLASQFSFLELEAGATPVKQGERAPGMFFLVCGAAEVVRDGAVLAALGPGDVFGEMSMLLRTPASADVRASRKAWVLELPRARFQEIMMTYPQVLAYVSELGDQRRQKNSSAPADEAPERKVELL